MSSNRGAVYVGPGKVEVQDIADSKLDAPDGRRIEHGVILKVLSTTICRSDQHMVRGRRAAGRVGALQPCLRPLLYLQVARH